MHTPQLSASLNFNQTSHCSSEAFLLYRSSKWPKPKIASLEFLAAKLETPTLLLKRTTTRGGDVNWVKLDLLLSSLQWVEEVGGSNPLAPTWKALSLW
jgi:hypothetical protein